MIQYCYVPLHLMQDYYYTPINFCTCSIMQLSYHHYSIIKVSEFPQYLCYENADTPSLIVPVMGLPHVRVSASLDLPDLCHDKQRTWRATIPSRRTINIPATTAMGRWTLSTDWIQFNEIMASHVRCADIITNFCIYHTLIKLN